MARLMRGIVGSLAVIGLLLGMGCAPAAPTPPAAPTKPAAATSATKTGEPTSKPAASPAASAAAKPAATTAAGPAASADWKAEWDKSVAAAKQEGKIVAVIAPGDPYRNAVEAFRKAYPDITLEATGLSGPAAGPRLLTERQAGQYLWDVYVGSPQTGATVLKANGALDPVKPDLLLPEVLDSSKWRGGFDEGWMDNEATYIYCFQGLRDFFAYVNRDLVPESELSSFDQLLDPRWKGKIAARDPRIQGKAAMDAGELMLRKGEDWIRKLFAQDITIFQDDRQHAEALVRGAYPIGLSLERAAIESFYAQGLGKSVVPLEGDSIEGQKWSPGFGSVMLVNKAPHPNAAKVFINWLLSVDGQKAWAEQSHNNSRRLDVAGSPATALDPNLKYTSLQKESNVSRIDRIFEIAKEMLK